LSKFDCFRNSIFVGCGEGSADQLYELKAKEREVEAGVAIEDLVKSLADLSRDDEDKKIMFVFPIILRTEGVLFLIVALD
jgi:hypothetical protein